MTYFPQLSTGALTQYPIVKRRAHRTIVNRLDDGYRVVFADTHAGSIHWTLRYQDLSDAESETLLEFFALAEGRLGTFTFFDPAGNLAGWSETLTASAWQRNGLIGVNAIVADPLGSDRASTLTNLGTGSLRFGQNLSIPGTTMCCWSFYARCEVIESITLTRTSGGESASVTRLAGPGWRRIDLSSILPDGGTSSLFELSLAPGAQLDVFGFQVDAQPAPSQYVKTAAAGGVYPNTRFDMDEVTFTATAPNRNSCSLQLVTHANG